jgi:hypothetical protein
LALVFLLWNPGALVGDGSHDRGENGIWLAHGWIGADAWFTRYRKEGEFSKYRGVEAVRGLRTRLRTHGIRDLYPHLAPTTDEGGLLPVDPVQLELFLDEFDRERVMPWVGGVWGKQAFPEVAAWRKRFATDIGTLMRDHPRLAGIHVNIEPCRSGSPNFLKLLDDVRAQLPEGKLLSVAAYPPPTGWQPIEDIHWDQSYTRKVAARSDQLAVMMYDTALKDRRFYEELMAKWTVQILDWTPDTEVLLGLAAYEDSGVGYHYADVENVETGLAGVHAGLLELGRMPTNYRGVALYSGWEMDDAEWALLRDRFLR